MGIVNKEQTPRLPSKPNEVFQMHHPELLIAAAHGDSDEMKRLLLLLHRGEEDTARQVVLDVVEDTITDDVDKPAATATATPPSEAVTGAGDSILHVVASSGDGDEFLECAAVIVGKANHLLTAPNGKGDTPLHCAARLRNARMVSHLLALARGRYGTSDDERVKATLRMQNGEGETVLHEAVRVEDKEMIGELLSADSQLARVPLTDGASPLYLALSLGHRDIAKLLFEKDGKLSYSGPDGQNALHAAIQWKWGQETIKMVLERNKDLIKQADRPTGRTPLHYAALFGETSMTELLLPAHPSGVYLPDRNGSFPIHLAASNGQPHNVLALLQESGPYCAQLRDGKGRTFLHIAVKDESWAVVKYACQEHRKMFASSVMNMQDNDGNTALHLAVEVGDIRMVHALVSIPEVKLNLTNKEGETPREFASRYGQQEETNLSYWNPRSRIYWLLHNAAHLTASPRDNILPREIHNVGDVDISQIIAQRTQFIGLGSVLITTVTFAAAFAVPGGYRTDGTPVLAGQYAFNAFVMANTLAFAFSGLSIIFLMLAGLAAESGRHNISLVHSINLLAWSARSLSAALTFGMYAVLAPVKRKNAFIPSCGVMVGALMGLEVGWGLWAVKTVFDDRLVLVKRIGGRAWWWLPLLVLGRLMFEFHAYILISLSALV
ncbi:hypothetical protein ACQJBY_025905 [Aegilops geniculata]